MTLKELAADYRKSAALLKERIAELRAQIEDGKDLCEMDKFRLRGRIDTLTAMYHETSLTAYTLERYYEKGGR